ncbi:MAG: serine--tRNA ligase [Candidatus Thermoplasmatota archaeon]|nr:serine--tRNA ligase [Candidatus Thermoplasmatota archaeon]
MIDIHLLRENPEMFRKAFKARGFDESALEDFFRLDSQWREKLKDLNTLRHEKNDITASISSLIKEGKDVEDAKGKVKSINERINSLETEMAEIENARTKVLNIMPNLLHESVPVCKGDENNQFHSFWGNARVYSGDLEEFKNSTAGKGKFTLIERKPVSHVDLLSSLDLADLERASRVSGARFFYLKNRLVKLELALVNYAVDFLSERGFNVVEPPYMLNLSAMSGATDMETFKDTLYKMEGEDLYLISTSEHPIASMYMGETLESSSLPLRIAGVSPCFRREAGAHGKDTKGIFRVHQFTKIEQFIFCHPDESWEFLEELLKNSEDIFRNLEIPYRVVNVCSGELGNLAAKKYDIEAWFPAQGKFREVVSASNDTDYQARSLGIKFRGKSGNQFVHTLNSTAIATTRTIVAIMENFQSEDGKKIKIPEVLVPYTGFDTIS